MNHRNHSELSLHLVMSAVTRVKATITCLLGNKVFTHKGNRYLSPHKATNYVLLATNGCLSGNKRLFLCGNAGISPHSFCANFNPFISGRNQYFGCFRDYISGGLRVVGNGLDVIGNGLRVTSYLLCVVCKVLYVMGLYITIYALGVNALGLRRSCWQYNISIQ